MTDQLAELFAAARSSALAEVRPPGIEAAHQAVRRRRIGTPVAAAVALVSVVTVGVVLVRRDDHVPPARPPALGSDLSAWADSVTLAVGVDHRQGPAEVLTSTGSAELRSVEAVFGGGTYGVTAACAGEGVMTLAFDVGAAVAATAAVPCSSPPRPVHTSVTVAESLDEFQVRAAPDATAAGHAVVAFQLKLSDRDRTRLREVAMAALPDAGSVATSALLQDRFGVRDGTVRPGRYRAWFSCFGTGTVRLTVDLVTDEGGERTRRAGQAALTCAPKATVGAVSFTVPAAGVDAVDANLDPDLAALGAAAVRLERL